MFACCRGCGAPATLDLPPVLSSHGDLEHLLGRKPPASRRAAAVSAAGGPRWAARRPPSSSPTAGTSIPALIEQYARRMTIEQRLAEISRPSAPTPSPAPSTSTSTSTSSSMSWPKPSSPRSGPGSALATPPPHPTPSSAASFLDTPGTILNDADTITVILNRRATHRPCANPTSPQTQSSPGGKAANSASSSPDKPEAESAARKSR
jgi:hypothetical protein